MRPSNQILATLALVLLALAPPVWSDDPSGGDSPEDVLDQALAANGNRDMARLLALVAPDQRARVLLDLFDMGSTACTQTPDQVAPLCAFLESKGLTDEMPKALAGIEDESELAFEERQAHQLERANSIFADTDVPELGQQLMKVLVELGAPSDDDLFTWQRLDSVEIEGDRATGHEEGRQDVLRFVRVDGRWYMTWRGLL